MKGKIKTIVEVLLLALVTAFVAAMALGVFVDLFWSIDPKPTEAFRGAFLGAFFAFLFVRLAEALNRFYDAGRRNRAAMALVQFELNEILSITSDDLFILDQWDAFVHLLRSASGAMPVFTNHLSLLPNSPEPLVNMTSIGLVNELFLLHSEIRKMNDSMETWQRAVDQARQALIAKHINPATYAANVHGADQHAKELRAFLSTLQTDAMSTLAVLRTMLNDKPFLAKVYGWLNPDPHPSKTGDARQEELKKLNAEVKEISDDSRKRIDAAMSTIKQGEE